MGMGIALLIALSATQSSSAAAQDEAGVRTAVSLYLQAKRPATLTTIARHSIPTLDCTVFATANRSSVPWPSIWRCSQADPQRTRASESAV